MSQVIIVSNPVLAKIDKPSVEVSAIAKRLMQYKVPTSIDQYVYETFYDLRKGTFPAGFARPLVNKLRSSGFDVLHHEKPAPTPAISDPKECVVDSFGYDNPIYSYQPETVSILLRLKAMTAQLATGAGKSRVAKMAHKAVGGRTLFLTTRKQLMFQMARSVEETMGEEVGILGASNLKLRQFTVATVKTVAPLLREITVDGEAVKLIRIRKAKIAREAEAYMKRLKESGVAKSKISGMYTSHLVTLNNKHSIGYEDACTKVKKKVERHNKLHKAMIAYLESVDLLIAEEAHDAGGREYYAVTQACKNAHYRLGLTATPGMSQDEAANMRLYATCGPVGITVTEKQLIDTGVNATPYFRYLIYDKPPELDRRSRWPRAYKTGIVHAETRNRAIVEEAIRSNKQYGMSVLILVLQQDHGKILSNMLADRGVDAAFIFGETDQDTRDFHLKRLANGGLLVASTILDVGVDVPSLGHVILGGGGKAEREARQRIGRGLRASYPNVAFFTDCADTHHAILNRHYLQRRAIIEQTPGFAEGLLGSKDFNFNLLET